MFGVINRSEDFRISSGIVNMELAIRQRTSLKGNVTRVIKHLENVDLTAVALNRIDDQLKQLSKEAAIIYTSILQLANDQEAEAELKDFEELSEIIFIAELKLVDKLQITTTPLNPGCTANIGIPNANSRTHTLPKLNLPRFSGLSKDWLSFSDLFTASIINNLNLTNAQRLQFLKTCLAEQPLHLIQSLSVTDDNFKIAWSDNPSGILQLVDNTSELIRTLETLGRTEKMGNDLLTHLVLQRRLQN